MGFPRETATKLREYRNKVTLRAPLVDDHSLRGTGRAIVRLGESHKVRAIVIELRAGIQPISGNAKALGQKSSGSPKALALKMEGEGRGAGDDVTEDDLVVHQVERDHRIGGVVRVGGVGEPGFRAGGLLNGKNAGGDTRITQSLLVAPASEARV